MDTPLGGERLNESGIERVLDVAHKKGKVNNHNKFLLITMHSTPGHRAHEV